jgi:hypothetical protein
MTGISRRNCRTVRWTEKFSLCSPTTRGTSVAFHESSLPRGHDRERLTFRNGKGTLIPFLTSGRVASPDVTFEGASTWQRSQGECSRVSVEAFRQPSSVIPLQDENSFCPEFVRSTIFDVDHARMGGTSRRFPKGSRARPVATEITGR